MLLSANNHCQGKQGLLQPQVTAKACTNVSESTEEAQSNKSVWGRWIWVGFHPSAEQPQGLSADAALSLSESLAVNPCCSLLHWFLPGLLSEMMWELPRRSQGEREEGRQGGQGKGTVVAVSALHPQPLPCALLLKQTQRNPCQVQHWGTAKGTAEGDSRRVLHPFSLLLSGSTPRSHSPLHGLGMTLRSVSPLLSISFPCTAPSAMPGVLLAIAGSHSPSLSTAFPPALRAGKVQHPGSI